MPGDPTAHPLAVAADTLFVEALIAETAAARTLAAEAREAATTVTVSAGEAPAVVTLAPTVEKVMVPMDSDSVTDVILRIRSHFAVRIAIGKKNHEYRAYRLHDQVKHLWLWEDDDQVIRWVITIGAPKKPGEVNDPEGDGNDDFDAGLKISPYGYPISAVYRLPSELTAQTLLVDYGVDMEQGRQYVKRALVDAFPLATLECVVPQSV